MNADRTGRVTVFGPNPLLSVTIEARGGAQDDIHLHPAGQGVWLGRTAAEVGAHPILCGFIGGETGAVLAPLLEALPGERQLVPTAAASGCYVVDRRGGQRRLISESLSGPFSRHEVDDLFSAACASAFSTAVLAVCNPMPAEALPLEVYANLVADARANGAKVIVDLSSPRLDSALEGEPDLVKVNDWELAEFVRGPVDGPDRLRAATEKLIEAGARAAVVTRGGEPALTMLGDTPLELVPPRLERGFREGCGDAMMGGVAAALAFGAELEQALVQGAAAGAATFLRHGLGTGTRGVIEELAGQVLLRPAGEPGRR